MVFVGGCSTVQRDFYQAPPPEPAATCVTATAAQDVLPIALVALDREGLALETLDSLPALLLADLDDEGEHIGQILIVRHDPQSPESVAVEVRYGRFGNPREERRLADAVASALDRATTPEGSIVVGWTPSLKPQAPGPKPQPLTGRWIDLEAAVAQAGKTKQSVDFAVVGVDRWRYATFFDLRTLAGAEGRLIVIGDRESAAGPLVAYMRLGRFGDPAAETELLDRLQAALSQLRRHERLPGAR